MEDGKTRCILNPLLGSFRNKEKGQRAWVVAALLPVCVGRTGTERSRAAIPGEHKLQRAGPKAFSRDQGLFEHDKMTLETVWRRRKEKEKKKPSKLRGWGRGVLFVSGSIAAKDRTGSGSSFTWAAAE